MSERSDWRLYLPEPIRTLPADLAAVVAMVVLTLLATLTPGLDQTPLRVVVGLPFVLFVPGYALIAALFPERGPAPHEGDDTDETLGSLDDDAGIDGIERVALSFGTSIAVVPLLGLVLNFTPWGIRLVPILVAVSGFTLVGVAAAASRRNALPEDERFIVPYDDWLAAGKSELFEPATRTDAMLNVVLAVSVVLAMGSVGYAVAVPKDGESFSELYLLTENDDGELVADGYPEELVRGEPASLVVGVGNQEHQQVNYTTVVLLQRVEVQNNSTTVLEQDRLRTFSPTLAHNETWHQQHQIRPTMTGERLRLTYLLYKGAPPASPSAENAYREVHLWVTVRDDSTATA
ncbi:MULTISPECIES: DUF1616 domain-containing protein [Haloferax]|uniref:DUF1616 domain-containing protein n=2 Tax=Haloferax TaxID=2251 RepID=A0A6G1Z105_9EURY|nr:MULTISPECIES: DUF1616 domain-containing protein [Haloferax]KAB1187547.1 DUF1616 domain-containing protein [Haloferax sp. CBA1149]MRW80203.1 DUF1616 domain-containing protein [Haloferax marinisediminis]